MEVGSPPWRALPRLVFVSLMAAGILPAAAAIDFVHVDGFEDLPDCSTPLACPLPAAGKSCISGQLTSAETRAPLRAFFNQGSTCGAGAIGGPCDLRVTPYDSLDFVQNPAAASPLAFTERIVDGCGRFRINGLTPPAFGFVALVVDDADAAAENNFHAPSATPRALGANVRVDNVEVIAARNDSVAAWTQTAGAPFGASSFVDVGAVLVQFSAAGVPRAGVAVTLNGNPAANKDYYFSDAVPTERTTVDAALTATGPNGSALVVDSGLVSFSGFGGEPPACTWPSANAATVPGVLYYIRIDC